MTNDKERMTGLKKIRKERGLTQIMMANNLGICAQCYRNFETGRRQPKLDMLKRFADVLGCSVSDIVGE